MQSLRYIIKKTIDQAKEAKELTENLAKNTRDKVSEYTEDMKESITETTERMKRSTAKVAESVSHTTQTALAEVGEKAGEVADSLESYGSHVAGHVKSSVSLVADAAHEGASKVGEMGKRSWSAITLPFLGQRDLLRYLGELTQSAATKYDKALDRTYLETYVGGGYHRLFDGGHDVVSAWGRVREVAGDDSFTEQVIGYISALWKDVTTVRGLPYATVPKDSFDSWVQRLDGIPGVNRAYLSDLISFDAIEIISTSLSAVGVFFALKDEDQTQLASILGSMGITSIVSANPLMGIYVIATSAYAFRKKKMEFDKLEFAKSSIITVTSLSMFSVLGLPMLANLVVVTVVTKLVRNKVLDNDELHEILLKNLKEIKAPNISLKDAIPTQTIEDGQEFFEQLSGRMRELMWRDKSEKAAA